MALYMIGYDLKHKDSDAYTRVWQKDFRAC